MGDNVRITTDSLKIWRQQTTVTRKRESEKPPTEDWTRSDKAEHGLQHKNPCRDNCANCGRELCSEDIPSEVWHLTLSNPKGPAECAICGRTISPRDNLIKSITEDVQTKELYPPPKSEPEDDDHTEEPEVILKVETMPEEEEGTDTTSAKLPSSTKIGDQEKAVVAEKSDSFEMTVASEEPSERVSEKSEKTLDVESPSQGVRERSDQSLDVKTPSQGVSEISLDLEDSSEEVIGGTKSEKIFELFGSQDVQKEAAKKKKKAFSKFLCCGSPKED